MSIEQAENLRKKLQESLDKLIKKIGKIQIGSKEQFPFGWRKAAKGRTVWRILEELINQNLEKFHEEVGISNITPSDSVLTPQIAGHNLKNKLGLFKFGNYVKIKQKIYT